MEGKTIDLDKEWEHWVAWLGEGPGGPSIWDDVVAMMAARQVWDGFAVLHHNAPDFVFRGGTFTSWLKNNYIGRQALAVRRQVDLDPDVVSLARLIDRIRRYPKALSRDRYAKQTAWQSSEEANESFDKLVGPGLEHIDPNVPKADFAKLRTRTARIVRFATNELAHYNEAKGTFADGLTLGDVHGAISLIVDLSVKYRLLVIGSDMSKIVAMDSWLHVFEQPWIADRDRLMEIHRRMEALWAKRADGESLTDADYTV